eukprot:6180177-Lingulodinium_polyedra.AAC.1
MPTLCLRLCLPVSICARHGVPAMSEEKHEPLSPRPVRRRPCGENRSGTTCPMTQGSADQ